MARSRAARGLAYSDGIFPRFPGQSSLTVRFTHSDGRRRERQGQAEWQKPVEVDHNRHRPSQPISTLRQKATTPAVIGFPVHRAGKAGLIYALATLCQPIFNVM